jgi:putative endonuclease
VADHNDLGRWGEDQAAAYLMRKGYVIVERDWKSGHRDLDIIALDGEHDELVFVEVKTRRNRLFADPEVAVGYQKIRNLQQAANHYVKYRNVSQNIRFDLVTVVGTPDGNTEIEHIENAF